MIIKILFTVLATTLLFASADQTNKPSQTKSATETGEKMVEKTVQREKALQDQLSKKELEREAKAKIREEKLKMLDQELEKKAQERAKKAQGV